MSTTDPEDFLSGVPLAATPRFSMSEVNEPIELYTGPITLEGDNQIKIPLARVIWYWRREPIILCGYDSIGSDARISNAFTPRPTAHKVTLDNIGVTAWMVPHEFTSCGPQHHDELRIYPAVLGTLGPIRRAQIHLVNCPDVADLPIRTKNGAFTLSGRLALRSKDWQIFIDQVPNYGELERKLRKDGGQAITHVLQVSRVDNSDFTVEDFNCIVNDFCTFYSFATGVRPTVCLPSGYDSDEKLVWECWAECPPSAWMPISTWATHRSHGQAMPGQVSRSFPGFMAAMNHADWREPLQIVVDWYLQAKHKGLETALVLGQASLELFANTAFELSTQPQYSLNQWDHLTASARIKWLLLLFGIDPAVPPKLSTLMNFRFADGTAFEDGPHALTALRNAITHPKKQNRVKFGSDVEDLREEAAKTAVFYLEHLILRLTGFDGIANAEWTHGYWFGYERPTS